MVDVAKIRNISLQPCEVSLDRPAPQHPPESAGEVAFRAGPHVRQPREHRHRRRPSRHPRAPALGEYRGVRRLGLALRGAKLSTALLTRSMSWQPFAADA